MRVAVLGGGRSSEHEVSLSSAASVRAGLAQAGHDVVDVQIGRDGRWLCQGEAVALIPGEPLLGADVVFPVLHGPYGEDGSVQGMLDTLGVPYVGAGVLASAVCMDKLTFKRLMGAAGLPQVDYVAVLQHEWDADRAGVLAAAGRLARPAFVKPSRLGSSVGIVRVATADGLEAAIETALGHDPRVIVEAFADGLEVECSVLGNEAPVVSEPGEIVVKGASGWYDYEAKYTPGGMELVVPARISAAARERVQALAAAAFAAAGVSGMSRVDCFVRGEEVAVSEVNTIPGFTETSVFGKLLAASGIAYPDLLDRLLALGLERHERERAHAF
jgi:D-alanine-D-alanine ligase